MREKQKTAFVFLDGWMAYLPGVAGEHDGVEVAAVVVTNEVGGGEGGLIPSTVSPHLVLHQRLVQCEHHLQPSDTFVYFSHLAFEITMTTMVSCKAVLFSSKAINNVTTRLIPVRFHNRQQNDRVLLVVLLLVVYTVLT